MPTTTPSPSTLTSPNGHRTWTDPPGPGTGAGPRLSWQRRRQLPLIAVGVLLVAGCALLFASISTRGSSARPVLVAARSLPAGHVLGPADLTTVGLRGTTVASVPAAGEAGVVGRPLSVPVQVGALLIPADLGAPAGVSVGQAVVALALKPGQYPPMLGPGDHVQIIDTASTAGASDSASGAGDVSGAGMAAGSAGPVAATVLTVDPQPEGSAAAVVASVQVAQAQAAAVAGMGAAGTGSLVLLASGPGAG